MRGKLIRLTLFIVACAVEGSAWSASAPLSRVDLTGFLAGRFAPEHVVRLIQQRGLDFTATESFIQSLKTLGEDEAVLEALRTAKTSSSSTGVPDGGTKDSEVLEHLTRGIQLRMQREFSDVEREFREAVHADPNNALLHYDLALAMSTHTDAEFEAVQGELREALRLQPDFGEAHSRLALVLRHKGDLEGAVAEYREAVSVEPDNFIAHDGLASALQEVGDSKGAIAEYRAAAGVLPEYAGGHANLASALESSGDLNGAATELREAIRLRPDFPGFHIDLARVLERMGDHDAAQEQRRQVQELNSKSAPPARIRVGGTAMVARLVKKVNPHYPAEARKDGVQGQVRLEVVIDHDGAVKECKVLEGPAQLTESATEAVRQWRWKPVLLDGKPVEVVTEIDFNFAL